MTALVSRLLVHGLFGAEIWDQGQLVAIHPEEDIHVARAGAKRRRDFALGRACARAALAGLGLGEAVIAKDENGAPLWPPGVTGSITHTDGFAAALVGQRGCFGGIGIDAERVGGVTQDLWPRLFTLPEQRWLATDPDPLLAATLLFSVKEACYKAWGMKTALVFRDIEVVLEGEGFAATRADMHIGGRYAMENGVVLVAAWIGR